MLGIPNELDDLDALVVLFISFLMTIPSVNQETISVVVPSVDPTIISTSLESLSRTNFVSHCDWI